MIEKTHLRNARVSFVVFSLGDLKIGSNSYSKVVESFKNFFKISNHPIFANSAVFLVAIVSIN